MPSARRTPSPTSSSFCSNPKSSTSTLSTTITTTTSDRSAPASGTMSDEDDGVPPTIANNPATPPSPLTPPPLPTSTDSLELPSPPLPSTTTRTTSFPIREDCWSEDATHTLIEAWGAHYLELNRGNLRQKHWQEVADAVNAIHGHTKKLRRTDIQCKNRIDTLKKKYKVEKSKALQSNGRYVSTWPFFASIDSLIGDSFMKAKPPSPSPPLTRRNSMAANNTLALVPAPVRRKFPALPPLPSVVPVGPRSKRPAPTASVGEESLFRRNFSAMAAAAAAVESVVEDEVCEDNSDTSSAVAAGMGRRKRKRAFGKVAAEGYRKLAEAIGGFSEIYERVEEAKQRQIVELEKQRMQFAKDLEIQRMKLFMESQVHLKKLKRAKLNSQSDGYS